MAMGDNSRQQLKSGASLHRAYLRFVNKSRRLVDIIWFNYQGFSVKYKTLRPAEFVDVNTFTGHPWAFYDSLTGCKLIAQRKEIFSANLPENDEQITRKIINITIPVYTLQECCIQFIRSSMSTDDVDKLNIPVTLKRELKDCKHLKSFGRPVS